MNKIRANILIIDGEKILLMHRIKNGDEYFTLIGGSVEDGEDIREAAIREAKEETGLDVAIDKEIWKYFNEKDQREHYCFLVTKYSGKLKLGYPEADRVSETNKYFLEWHDVNELKNMNLFPEKTKAKILQLF